MTNIESKRFKITGVGLAGMVNLHDKKTGKVVIVCNTPSTEYLAALHESTFDKECEAALRKGVWSTAT